MRKDLILRIAAKLILPFILLFGLYVQFHGDYGPGGGFQAGVIAAAMIILYSIIFGIRSAQSVISNRFAEFMVPLGVLIYTSVGIITMFGGGNFLSYSALEHDPVKGQHLGIMLVELGVFITVAGTMIAIFYTFVGRGR
jgi:multicomponent Na+:H+ antiporter subunit B